MGRMRMRKDRNRFLKDFKLQKLQKRNTDLKDAPIVGVDSIYQQFISKFNSSSDLSVTEFPHLTVKIYYFSYLINKDQSLLELIDMYVIK